MPVDGVSSLLSRLRKADSRARNSVTKGMKTAADHLLTESQKLVPIDTGALAATGQVVVQEAGIEKTTIDVSYGSEAVDYAWHVHENPLAAHGEAFNIKHADEIASGKHHLRRPEETFQFLAIPANDLTAVRRALHRGIQ